MKTELVRIGNSRGVRIPKPFIEQCGLGETVDLRVADDCLHLVASAGTVTVLLPSLNSA